MVVAHHLNVSENLYLQNKVNAESTMTMVELQYGPFENEEIVFYKRAMLKNKNPINSFQKDLIFNLFYRYFGDPQSVNAINFDDYIKLMIAARRILETSGMVVLPYLISGRVVRLATRKNVNKKELTKLEASPLYAKIKEKYNSEKIEKHILSIIAVILSSEFEIIDPDDEDLNGTKINALPEVVCEEVLMYISLI